MVNMGILYMMYTVIFGPKIRKLQVIHVWGLLNFNFLVSPAKWQRSLSNVNFSVIHACLHMFHHHPLTFAVQSSFLKNELEFVMGHTVAPFKFAAIKVGGFDIMPYSRPFNFVVSHQNYFIHKCCIFLHKLKYELCVLKIIKFWG